MGLQPRSKGEPLSIRIKDWNKLRETVQWVEMRKLNLGKRTLDEVFENGEAQIENNTGLDMAPGDIVAIREPVSEVNYNNSEQMGYFLVDGKPLFSASYWYDLFTTKDHKTLFGVVKGDILNGNIGRAIVFGITPCMIKITNNDHEYAKPSYDYINSLVSAYAGPAKILYKPEKGDDEDELEYAPCVVAMQEILWLNTRPVNKYIIDRTKSEDDEKAWQPERTVPEDWEEYDGVELRLRLLRYIPGDTETAGILHGVKFHLGWLTKFAPSISKAEITAPGTENCPEEV